MYEFQVHSQVIQLCKCKLLSSVQLFVTPWLYRPGNSSGQNTGVSSLSLLQGIFQIQGSNPDLLNCRWILYQRSHKGSPRILEQVAYPFPSRSSQPRNWTRVSCIAGGFFINWAIREYINIYFFQILVPYYCSVTWLCPTLCPMDYSMAGFPVLHYVPEFAQTHVHRVGDATQPSHPLSPPSSALNLSQHQGLFQWVGSSHQLAKVLEL